MRGSPTVAARFGTLFMIPDEQMDPEKVFWLLRDALLADSRVQSVTEPHVDPGSWRRSGVFPFQDPNISTFLDGGRTLTGLRLPLAVPLVIEVSVPTMHADTGEPLENGTLEEYFVFWNGLALLVGWYHLSNSLGFREGQVVFDILTNAASSLGVYTLNQGCSPDCELLFGHKLSLLRATPGSPMTVTTSGSLSAALVYLNCAEDISSLMGAFATEMLLPVELFSELKNIGFRFSWIEDEAQKVIESTLRLERSYAGPVLARNCLNPAFWRRRYRSRVEGLRNINRLWTLFAVLQRIRRDWLAKRRAFELNVDPGLAAAIFSIGYEVDTALMEAFDSAPLLANIEQISMRIESRTLAIATGLGVVAAGVLGAVVTAILQT